MDYGAMTLDTSIFDQKSLKLESGILKTLEQFKGKPSGLVISEIVSREVHDHLKKKAKESRKQVTKAIRESMQSLSVSKEKSEIATKVLIPEDDDNKVAKNRIDSFIKNTGAKIVRATGRVEIDDIIKKYFKSEPPFAETGKKKNEFPDAIALMSLESWAKENRTKILAVANDGDWEKFAEQSQHIDVIKDLAEAIAKFQPHSSAITFCSLIAEKLPRNKPEELYESINQYLSHAIEEIDLYPEASSQFSYEPDHVEVFLDDFEFITDDNGHALLQPVQEQHGALIVEAKINVTATASTSFSLSVRDSIDKDYVFIGYASASTELVFESEILLTFEGELDDDIRNIGLTEFELLSYPSDANFGEIEPDWWDED